MRSIRCEMRFLGRPFGKGPASRFDRVKTAHFDKGGLSCHVIRNWSQVKLEKQPQQVEAAQK